MTSPSEAFNVPFVCVDAANNTTRRVLIPVHAARPRILALLARAVRLVLARVNSLLNDLPTDSLLHVRAQGELGVRRDVSLHL